MSAAVRRTVVVGLSSVTLAAVIGGCGSSSSSPPAAAKASSSPASTGGSGGASQGKFTVVAGGELLRQHRLTAGGEQGDGAEHHRQTGTDPHSYQPTAQDARTLAGAKMAIVNGIGYDNWMTQGLVANPVSGRVVLTVGDLLGLKEGDNAHQWYSPVSVLKVVDQITSDYDKLDPADSAYFAQQKHTFLTQDLAQYSQLRAEIRAKYAGIPIGYSESIFQPTGENLGLKLLTPTASPRRSPKGLRSPRRTSRPSTARRRTVRSTYGSTTVRTSPLTCSASPRSSTRSTSRSRQ